MNEADAASTSPQGAGGISESADANPEGAVCWRGLGFGIDELRLATTFDDVSDVVACGAVTPVPRTRQWLRGIANVRGTICSVVDLSLYFGRALIATEAKPKLLVTSDPGLQVALLVPRVLGLKQFRENEESSDLSKVDIEVRPYVVRLFSHKGEDWAVLDIPMLIRDRAFRNVAMDA